MSREEVLNALDETEYNNKIDMFGAIKYHFDGYSVQVEHNYLSIYVDNKGCEIVDFCDLEDNKKLYGKIINVLMEEAIYD